MNSRSERLLLSGAAGAIEAVRDGVEAPRGVAIIAHPHPLFGGTMDNKVVQTLARAFVQCGWTALRFNFRGVGASAGLHDAGRGELQDLLAVAEQVAPHSAGQRIALAGFSFGASVASHALAALWPQGRVEHLVLVGLAASRCAAAPLPPEAHLRTLVVHGEHDDTVPLSAVLDWARPQVLPVTVIPAGGHFFHGQLPLLKSLVLRHLRSVAAPP
ncbi:alpha/beta hydrolase [Verminephrobacter eiseniae]|uniref:Putative transmembrane protein n=1 Tax=Verminephrobacter eiseniae (strain EF01-2) TaxID=391735 RepID=A1WEV8_VEREI|nr:alpha/beta fold hydrolase [Verminephrobacter eiseniae]ABM56165.1 putative transmembrane protein [Verminephrobacter eiseniae EF01-2]MCW5286535.1 alpha/beta hydrolase [Verminephrobacter eiseniae]MCW5304834.1 alpha/beta hydrolase [Verminephrobacter eiseniae]MCW8182934.1 alpha/beta hydrolase [Verminephrobacter eiseniae]MCW8191068.1 alpha/beta hydrolase [Verminephrobacter eiseniae]